MHIEFYTLPLAAVVIFFGAFSLGLLDTTAEIQSASALKSFERSVFVAPASQGASAARVIAGTDLVGSWAFDEGAGVTALDGSDAANTGILIGSPVWVTLEEGSALFFDGVDDYVEIPSHPSLRVSDRFTIAAWVYPESTTPGTIVGSNELDEGTREGYQLAIENNRIVYRQGAHSLSAAQSTIGPSQWLHVTAVFDDSISPNMYLYVNGEPVLSSDIIALSGDTLSLMIGRNSSGDYFNGRIDDVLIYKRALSKDEIAALFEAGESRIDINDTARATSAASIPKDPLTQFFSNTAAAIGGVMEP